MSDSFTHSILRSLHRLFGHLPGNGASDAELLERFTQQRDESAFELLLWRHAALVLQVCRQTLRDEQLVEDAFQATWLVLLRKAGSIRSGEALIGWLYRVAHRVALRARRQARRREQAGVELPEPIDATPARLEEDLSALLHREVGYLPERYRVAVVSCYLEGRSHEEAAELLGWSKGTLAGRLARARDLLHKRLSRRGVALTAALVAERLAASTPAAGSVSRSVGLLLSGLRTMTQTSGAGGFSATASALAEGVIQSMFATKLKMAALATLLLGMAGLGTALSWSPQGSNPPADPPAQPRQPAGRLQAKAQADPENPIDRLRVRQQLRKLAIALHNYEAAHDQFPVPAILTKDGKPGLSWRVALLPYFEQEELYKQFKLDEPWDSPHNKKLIARMPAVFAPVKPSAAEGTTYFQYITGPGTIFPPQPTRPVKKASGGMGAGAPGVRGGMGPGGGDAETGGSGLAGGGAAGMGGPGGTGGMMPGMGMFRSDLYNPPRFKNIHDGASNTLLLVEGNNPVVWTQPEDVVVDIHKRLPAFGGQFPDVIHVALADGTVRSLHKRLPERLLLALITARGGEVIPWNQIDDLAKQGSGPRRAALDRLQQHNFRLKAEAEEMKAILSELRDELDGLRWQQAQKDKLLLNDPEAIPLLRANAELEQQLKQTREDARKLFEEVRKLREEMTKKKD